MFDTCSVLWLTQRLPYVCHDVTPYTHGGELCIISSHRICEEHMGTALIGASSTEMMQDFPLHVLAHVIISGTGKSLSFADEGLLDRC